MCPRDHGSRDTHDAAVNPKLYDRRYKQISRRLHSQTPASDIDLIEPDWNCLFRAISKELMGSEKYNNRIRKVFVSLWKTIIVLFRNGISKVQNILINTSGQRGRPEPGSEIEILAAATFFNTSLYEFTEEYNENHNTSIVCQVQSTTAQSRRSLLH